MKTLTSPVSTKAAASQSGWCEVYDFYLASSITTPWGTTNTLRLTTLANGFSFFTPQITPEPVGTQGNGVATPRRNRCPAHAGPSAAPGRRSSPAAAG